MTPGEWGRIKEEVETLFGNSSKWARFDDAYKHARSITYQSAMEAVQDAFNEGRTNPPTMSEIVAAARRRGGAIAGAAGPCRHDTFAVFDYHKDGSASSGLCVGCRTEMSWTVGKIRTPGL